MGIVWELFIWEAPWSRGYRLLEGAKHVGSHRGRTL